MIYDILKQPVISEKSFSQADEGKYVFWITTETNKIQVKEAVEKAFKVSVTAVNIINLKGKVKSSGKRRGQGSRKDRKKAIVTLKKGQEIKELKVS